MAGRFIALEGPDGSGKTTQAERLAAALRGAGFDVVTTREPGGTPLAERIRELVLQRAKDDHVPGPVSEALLFSAARADHVERHIAPSLADGRVVICDRFTGSTLAYQGGGRGLDLVLLHAVQRLATGGLEPDLTLLLDLPVEFGLARRFAADPAAVNRLDEADRAFHQRVRQAYLALADRPSWVKIDASQPESDVTGDMLRTVSERFGWSLNNPRREPHQPPETNARALLEAIPRRGSGTDSSR